MSQKSDSIRPSFHACALEFIHPPTPLLFHLSSRPASANLFIHGLTNIFESLPSVQQQKLAFGKCWNNHGICSKELAVQPKR